MSEALLVASLHAFAHPGAGTPEVDLSQSTKQAAAAKSRSRKKRGAGEDTEVAAASDNVDTLPAAKRARSKKTEPVKPRGQASAKQRAAIEPLGTQVVVESAHVCDSTTPTDEHDASAIYDDSLAALPNETAGPITPPRCEPHAEKASGKKYRQAKEAHDGGEVEVLCFKCRRSKDTTKQMSVMSFFKKAALPPKDDSASFVDLVSDDAHPTDAAAKGVVVCAKCRRPMVEKAVFDPTQDTLKGAGAMPHLQRLRNYERVAKQSGVPFMLTEKEACAMMRSDCVACGAPAPQRGHGLTRLRRWPEGIERLRHPKAFMGPFVAENVATACTMCNMMKGYRKIPSLVEMCRHIASKHTPGEHFGEYPHRFRDNVSKRSRSSYITNSTTHTKTHAITNEEFNKVTGEKCFYCHKEPRKVGTLGSKDRGHYNGLDRLDSSNRLYTVHTVVACCGDCNMMKYRWTLDIFLDHCRQIARFNEGKLFEEDSDAKSDADPDVDNEDGPDVGDDADVGNDVGPDIDNADGPDVD